MARLIVKSPYIQCGKQNAGGYLRYIATRERVEIIPDDRPPTRKQEQFIAKLVKDFPDVKELLEYEDYVQKPTKANASSLITLALEEHWKQVQLTHGFKEQQMAKLLVVDDEVGIRELLSEILEDEGHDVLTAEDAGQARKLIEENPLDLILLDIWMPDTDGVTLLRELSSQHLIHCPVIMMSGHATIDTAVEATKFGAFDFLEKPISMQRLLSSVSNALAQETPADTESRQQDAETQSEPSEAKAVIYGHNGNELATIPFTLELRDARDSFEKLYLQSVLEEESYSMSKVAARTGLERTHLYRKLKQLEITLPAKEKTA